MLKKLSSGVVLGFLALFPDLVSAADHTVKPDGSGDFTTIQACAKAVQPGGTCRVYPGDYPEHPQTVRGGSPGNPITFKAVFSAQNPATEANQRATTKGFRIRHAYVTVDGFDITKYDVGLDQAHISVEAAADSCIIQNNVIRDGIYLSSTNYFFDAAAKTITNAAGGFVKAGFAPGVTIYIASDINNQIKNHDNNAAVQPAFRYETKTIASVTDTVLTLVASNTVFTEGPVMSTIYANRAEKNGVWGIIFNASSSIGSPDNCLVNNNKFSNLAGRALQILGNNNIVENNTFIAMNGWRMFSFVGNNNVFRYNVFRNSPRWPGFSLPKSSLASEGSGTWDMYDNIFVSDGAQANNNVIEYNFFEGLDEQFARVTEDGSSGLIIRNNIFVGYELSGSISRPGTQIVNNTFYASAWKGSLHNFNLAKSSVHGNPVNSVIKNNAFIATARAADPNSGWYSITGYDNAPTTGVAADFNFVTGAASAGYPAKTGFKTFGRETHGINGGNPVLGNPNNPLGPDGIPFTLDDGLKPLTTSLLCKKGEGGVDIGAYSCDPTKVFAEGPVPPPPPPGNLRIIPPR